VRVNPADPPGALRRLGRRKLELGHMVLEGRREAQSRRPSSLRHSEGWGGCRKRRRWST
jgi:hypothetical protein